MDDFSREAVAQIRPDRTSGDATAFSEQLVAALPYRIEAVMTDNDLIFTMRYAFHSQRQSRFQQACRSLGIEHWKARPRHPESNGKVERFSPTLDEECFAVHRPRSSILQPSAASSEPARPDALRTSPGLLSAAPPVTYVLG